MNLLSAYLCACMYEFTYIHKFIRAYIHTCIHTYVHTYIHTYTHTHINTYTHTYIHPHPHLAGSRTHRRSAKTRSKKSQHEARRDPNLPTVRHARSSFHTTCHQLGPITGGPQGAVYMYVCAGGDRSWILYI